VADLVTVSMADKGCPEDQERSSAYTARSVGYLYWCPTC
jgi:hypothetical protein